MSEKQTRLVMDNINLVYEITKRYRNRSNYEDIVSTGYLALCCAAQNFDEVRGNSFSTYAYSYILGKCLNFINFDKLIKPKRVGSVFVDVTPTVAMDDVLYKKLVDTVQDTSKKTDELLLLDAVRKLLTCDEYDIVIALYNGYNKKETMNALNLTVCQFNNCLKEIREKLSVLNLKEID